MVRPVSRPQGGPNSSAGTGWPRSEMRREALCCIPGAAGRNSKEGSWVQWLTQIRKVKGNNSMSAKQRSWLGVKGDALRDPCDMAKAGLPESQSPDDETRRPPERHMLPAPRSATTSFAGCRNLRGVERCSVRAIKEISGAPKSRSDVQLRRTRDQPTGREPHGDGVPIVVVRFTPHQGGRESRPQGEGAQVTGYPRTGRYA